MKALVKLNLATVIAVAVTLTACSPLSPSVLKPGFGKNPTETKGLQIFSEPDELSALKASETEDTVFTFKKTYDQRIAPEGEPTSFLSKDLVKKLKTNGEAEIQTPDLEITKKYRPVTYLIVDDKVKESQASLDKLKEAQGKLKVQVVPSQDPEKVSLVLDQPQEEETRQLQKDTVDLIQKVNVQFKEVK
ncbi:MAG: hypothetical protein AB7F43_02630 [Bacteriovoracia bacterium]